jgi:amino acid permease
MELSVAGSLGWVFYVLLCVVVWPAMLLVMYRVAITVLSAEREHDAGRGVARTGLSPGVSRVAGWHRYRSHGQRTMVLRR